MPSVRGRERFVVVAMLLGSAVTSGALVGFGLGASLAWLPAVGIQAGARFVVALVLLAAAGDLVWSSTGRLRPLRINRQVPREWSSMFSAPVTAGLYGARLGVGPLTMLNTWMWWAAGLGAALSSVGASVAIGATFAIVRVMVVIGTSLWAEGAQHQPRFEQLRRLRPTRSISLVGAAAAALLFLGACTEGARPEFAGPSADGASDLGTPTADSQSGAHASTQPDNIDQQEGPPVTQPESTRITTPTTAAGSTPSTSASSTSLAELVPDPQPETAEAGPLATALVDELPGFSAIDNPSADRSLDIDAAANIQPDPTEELPLLETRGFAGGWTRAFRNPSRDVIVTTVYEFVDHTEAAFYLEDGLITIGGYGGQFFEVPDIEESRGFRQEIEGDEPLLSVGVTFVRGNRWYLVYVIGATDTVEPETLIEAARIQAARAGGNTSTEETAGDADGVAEGG